MLWSNSVLRKCTLEGKKHLEIGRINILHPEYYLITRYNQCSLEHRGQVFQHDNVNTNICRYYRYINNIRSTSV